MQDLRQKHLTAQDPIVNRMKSFAGNTRWAYCEKPIYAFQAGFPEPPKIAMVTLKRYWSGQINNDEILEVCHNYQPGEILLKPEMINEEWRNFLNNYTMAFQDKAFKLLLRRL